jgi:GMP synthase-like glutamine amidotransferase
MVKALVIAHDHLSGAGLIGDALRDADFELEVVQVVPADRFDTPDVAMRFPEPTGYDLVLTLGAPWSVYDERRLGRWVGEEQQFLRAADSARVPVLGVCFGGQLLAAAHGGGVAPAARPEIGWHPTKTSEPDLIEAGPWFEWHFDSWTLPPGAREIARTEAASQAFVLNRNLAVQFHPEVTEDVLAGWLENGGTAVARAHGIDPQRLLAETIDAQSESAARAHRLVARFLALVAFPNR